MKKFKKTMYNVEISIKRQKKKKKLKRKKKEILDLRSTITEKEKITR